jgi:hypothetical protein
MATSGIDTTNAAGKSQYYKELLRTSESKLTVHINTYDLPAAFDLYCGGYKNAQWRYPRRADETSNPSPGPVLELLILAKN